MPPKTWAVNVAPDHFVRQLTTIESGVWGTPCAVTLFDGRSFECCLAFENVRYSDKGEWLNPQAVAEVRQTALRLPKRFADELHAAGESGMGYHIYVVDLQDGCSFVHVAGNLTIDLLDLPPGYTSADVKAVFPHAGRERSQSEGYRTVKEFQSLEYSR